MKTYIYCCATIDYVVMMRAIYLENNKLESVFIYLSQIAFYGRLSARINEYIKWLLRRT